MFLGQSMDAWSTAVVTGIFVLMIIFIIRVNIREHKRRKMLTREQRVAEDQEAERDMSIW